MVNRKYFYFYFRLGIFPPPKSTQGLGSFLGLVDPLRNRLASTEYFAKQGFSVLHAWGHMHFVCRHVVCLASCLSTFYLFDIMSIGISSVDIVSAHRTIQPGSITIFSYVYKYICFLVYIWGRMEDNRHNSRPEIKR